MLRIAIEVQDGRDVLLTVHGRIAGQEDVGTLRSEGETCLRQAMGFVLDLDGVPFIDGAGLHLLREWSGRGVILRGGSPFVGALLEAEGLRPAGPDDGV